MAKVDPYLRPLFDALHDMLDPERVASTSSAASIEVAPLAFMRGRAQPVDAPVLTPTACSRSARSGRRSRDRLGRAADAGARRLPAGPQGGLPRHGPGRRLDAVLREHLWFVRTPDDRRHGKRGACCRRARWSAAAPAPPAPVRAARRGARRSSRARPVPMDPYALGLLLGDGCLTTKTTPSFTTADPELAEALEAALPGIELRRKRGSTTCCATWTAAAAA